MATNYTQDQVEFMVNQYRIKPDRETVDMLAKELDKSIKSIIGKLSREGVYRKQVYTTKAGEVPVTKEFLISGLAELFEVDSSKLMGLEKAPKQVIKFLHDTIGETNG
jgi:hypothetical protein|tara:strand:+ start:97 stop:420 length:324 start_codon:yes stop_codon:yes gene_type:complete